MPTYEYACDACGNAWEMEQRISENPVKKCPKCGKMKARRMISGGGNFILKGSGWYADLYHKPSAAKTESSDKPSTETKAASESPSTESKPAAKTETTAAESPKPSKKKKAASSDD